MACFLFAQASDMYKDLELSLKKLTVHAIMFRTTPSTAYATVGQQISSIVPTRLLG